ncbi:MAG: hypothetical protein R3308_01570 [Thiohalobacterales bacterium]|nr:hypothetical protein [Thiohalobacterales bacterium]
MMGSPAKMPPLPHACPFLVVVAFDYNRLAADSLLMIFVIMCPRALFIDQTMHMGIACALFEILA